MVGQRGRVSVNSAQTLGMSPESRSSEAAGERLGDAEGGRAEGVESSSRKDAAP